MTTNTIFSLSLCFSLSFLIQPGKSSAPTMVRLDGVDKSLSHSDMAARIGQFGKTKSIVMLRAVKQVCISFSLIN